MPWNMKQHRLFEAAAHNKNVAKRVGIPSKTAAKMASEGISDSKHQAPTGGNAPKEKTGGGLSYMRGAQKHNKPDQPEGDVIGSHDEPREESANFGQREHHDGKFKWDKSRVGHHKSFASESESVDWPALRKGQDEGKSGYGNPEAGRTSLPSTPGIRQGEHAHTMGNKLPEHGLAGHEMRSEPRYDLQDETRGTVELPRNQYAEEKIQHPERKVPQEAHGYVKHIANALLSARNRR